MNIDVEAFGLYLAVIVAGILLVWSVWPAVWRKKKEELQLDPVPEPAPAPEPVAEIKPAPVASLEPVVTPEPAREAIKTDIDTKTEEAFVKAMETEAKKPVKVKKAPVKKEASFVPPAAPKPKKAPAKKAPKK